MRSFLILIALSTSLFSQARIGELTGIEGVRDNIIRGVGLVVGLNGEGDKSKLARRMIANVLKRSGVNALESDLDASNAAVVMVTARIDPFRRPGSRIDVTVSSMLDAKSLRGGTLLDTRLAGFDAETVYAIAEGPVVVNGVSAQGQSGSSVTINHPTVANIPNGALVEKAIPMRITDLRDVVTLNLKNQDWTTAYNIEKVVNGKYPGSARAVNAGVVEVKVPAALKDRVTEFIASIQDLTVEVHTVSKIVIDEKSGFIVAGANVRISKVAVAQGDLSVTVEEAPQPVVANSFTQGPSIAAVPRSRVSIEEEKSGLQVVKGGESVAQLAASLNALGASPRQLIAILQGIKAAGALHADLEVR